MIRWSVRVTPGAPRVTLARGPGRLDIRLDAPPVDGAANERLIGFLARDVLGVPRSAVRIVRGLRGRSKIVEADLDEVTADQALTRWIDAHGSR